MEHGKTNYFYHIEHDRLTIVEWNMVGLTMVVWNMVGLAIARWNI